MKNTDSWLLNIYSQTCFPRNHKFASPWFWKQSLVSFNFLSGSIVRLAKDRVLEDSVAFNEIYIKNKMIFSFTFRFCSR